MAQRHIWLFSLAALFSLSACGEHLGNYEVEEGRRVSETPRGDAVDFPHPVYREFLRIELSSSTNLNRMDTGAGLYVDADFCPMDNRLQIIAFGPLATDGHSVENWLRTTALQPSDKDGRFHYYVYVVPRSPARKPYSNSPDLIPEYDLRTADKDICLRFFIPGYNIVKSRSDVVEVPASALQTALRD